jgi:hypothetical protein
MALLSRREFLKLLGLMPVVAGGLGFRTLLAEAVSGHNQIRFSVNGQPVQYRLDKSISLLDFLRTDLGLMGTKYGCGQMADGVGPRQHIECI